MTYDFHLEVEFVQNRSVDWHGDAEGNAALFWNVRSGR